MLATECLRKNGIDKWNREIKNLKGLNKSHFNCPADQELKFIEENVKTDHRSFYGKDTVVTVPYIKQIRQILKLDQGIWETLPDKLLFMAFVHDDEQKVINYNDHYTLDSFATLGDAILHTFLTERLFNLVKGISAELLSRIRGNLEQNITLYCFLSNIGLCQFLVDKGNIFVLKKCSDIFEAIIGVLAVHIIDILNLDDYMTPISKYLTDNWYSESDLLNMVTNINNVIIKTKADPNYLLLNPGAKGTMLLKNIEKEMFLNPPLNKCIAVDPNTGNNIIKIVNKADKIKVMKKPQLKILMVASILYPELPEMKEDFFAELNKISYFSEYDFVRHIQKLLTTNNLPLEEKIPNIFPPTYVLRVPTLYGTDYILGNKPNDTYKNLHYIMAEYYN